MLRRLLVGSVGLLLCTALVRVSPVHADITYTQLTNALLTEADLSGSGLALGSPDTQQPLDPNLLQVIRQFSGSGATSGVVVALSIIAAQDGTPPPAAVISQVTDGTLLRAMASGIGAQTTDVSLKGSQGIGEVDQSAQFDAIISGATYRFYGSAFTRGRTIGMVLYGATIDKADPSDFLTIAGLQDKKIQNN
jgi:hypothetical protein